MNDVNKYIKLIYIFAILFITVHISRLLVDSGMASWYEFSYKPEITPPDSVFVIVWTFLYLTLGAALFFAIYDLPYEEIPKYNNPFLLQLFLQIAWCGIFFAKGELMWGLIILVIMILTAFRMLHTYTSAGRLSGGLVYPYLAWLLYAAWLNLNFVLEIGVSAQIQ